MVFNDETDLLVLNLGNVSTIRFKTFCFWDIACQSVPVIGHPHLSGLVTEHSGDAIACKRQLEGILIPFALLVGEVAE